jgi:hypothetical protein
MVQSYPIVCEEEYACNDGAFDDFLEYEVDEQLMIHPLGDEEQCIHKTKINRPLRRCTSYIPDLGLIYSLDNEVIVTATSSFTYLDILPPPSHMQYKNKMHKIRFNLDGRRYIVHEGKDILLRDIAIMS